jgi:hypothetical protein
MSSLLSCDADSSVMWFLSCCVPFCCHVISNPLSCDGHSVVMWWSSAVMWWPLGCHVMTTRLSCDGPSAVMWFLICFYDVMWNSICCQEMPKMLPRDDKTAVFSYLLLYVPGDMSWRICNLENKIILLFIYIFMVLRQVLPKDRC